MVCCGAGALDVERKIKIPFPKTIKIKPLDAAIKEIRKHVKKNKIKESLITHVIIDAREIIVRYIE